MKKFILILIAFLSMSTATFASDCVTCDPDSWQKDTIIETYSPCTFLIAYKYRECVRNGDTLREMELVSVNFFGDCNYTGSTAMVVDLATKFVLNQAYRVFGTLTDYSLNKEVSYKMPCCWQSDINNDYVSPCSGGDCMCCAVFDLRRNKDPNGFEINTFVYQRTNNSPPSVTASCGQGCDYVCEILDYITPGTPLPPNDHIPCQDECDNPSQWYQSSGNIINKFVTGTSTCSLSVSFQYRECDDFVEFNVSQIEYFGNDCNDDELLWRESIEGVLAELATRYSLPQEFRFNFSTCWKRDSLLLSTPPDPNVYRTVYKQCGYDNCCVASYIVSGTSGNAYISSLDYHLDTLNSFMTCGTDTECEFICSDDYVELPYNQTLSKKALNIEGDIFETSSEVVPNPTKGEVEVFVNSRYNGKVEFSIIDNTGKVLYTINGIIDRGKTKFEFNSKSLPTGVYYYNIKAGLQLIDSGKFIKE